MRRPVVLAALLAALLPAAWAAPGSSDERAPFRIRVGGETSPYRIFSAFALPGRELSIEIVDAARGSSFEVLAERGAVASPAPRGFVEVTAENSGTRLSPHFTLGQFVCKQEGGYLQYIVLRPRLLLKLEYLLRLVNEHGHDYGSFVVMSGYRTPFHNAAIRDVAYSRHIYGGAADIFADENPRDGVVDRRDAEWLYDLIDSRSASKPYEPFVGGLGSYGSTNAHGPFVHVDVRGFKARWGR